MKNLVNSKLALSLVALIGLFLVSCDKDNDPQTPAQASDVKGTYTGKLSATQGTAKKEYNSTFIVRDTLVIFDSFPITELVAAVVKDTAKTTAAVKALGNVKYELKYSGKVNTAKDGVDLTFTPKALSIEIPVDNAKKKAVITFKAENTGLYTARTKSTKFNLVAEKIVVDGTQLTPFTTIKYDLPSSNKK